MCIRDSYDVHRPFHKTLSPSMDILVSSNLERLLFEAADRDAGRVSEWMQALAREGRYTLPGWQTALEGIWAGCADDGMTCQAIADAYKPVSYTHLLSYQRRKDSLFAAPHERRTFFSSNSYDFPTARPVGGGSCIVKRIVSSSL